MNALTTLATASPVDGIVDRLQENLWRSGLTVALTIIVLMTLNKTVNTVLQWVAALGAGWLTWQMFNLLWGFLASVRSASRPRGVSTPLFAGEASLSGVAGFFTGSGRQFVVAIIAAALGYVVYLTAKKTKQNEEIPKVVRALAGVGTWAGVTMLYVIVVSLAPGLA